VVAGQSHQLGAGLACHIGGVDDGQQAAVQTLADDVVQHVEGVR
jgi:hypothetical protein